MRKSGEDKMKTLLLREETKLIPPILGTQET